MNLRVIRIRLCHSFSQQVLSPFCTAVSPIMWNHKEELTLIFLESLWSRNGYEEQDLKSNCKLGVRRVIIHVLLSPSSWGTKGQVVRWHTVPYSAIVTCDDKDHERCSQTYLIFWLHQCTNYVTLGNVISWDLHLLLWKMGRVRVATCIHFLRLSLEMTTTSVT